MTIRLDGITVLADDVSALADGNPTCATRFTGQAFELNLPCDSADEVERRFLAGPEGNIHSLFADV